MVKSHLVWNENSVNPTQMTHVTPTAISTCNNRKISHVFGQLNPSVQFTLFDWYWVAMIPNMSPWAAVNMAKNMKLWGVLRLISPQHAIIISTTNIVTNAIIPIDGFRATNILAGSWYMNKEINAIVIAS